MEQSGDKDQRRAEIYEVTTFPVPFTVREIKENIFFN